MGHVYFFMMVISLIGVMYYLKTYMVLGKTKRQLVTIPLVIIGVIGFMGSLHVGNVEKDTNAKELKSMGFTHVNMLFNSGADVASFASCSPELRLNKTAGHWVVVTDEIASEKPVVDEKELFGRKEVKWWCSRPPIKN